MTVAEVPLFVPEQRKTPLARETTVPELELPASMYPWVAALALWPCVDEPSFRLVAHCFGEGRAPSWDFLVSLLIRSGLVEPGSAPETFTIRTEWLPAFERGLLVMGGAEAVRGDLVAGWLDTGDRLLVAVVVGWASDLALWDAMDAIWMVLTEQPGGPPLAVLAAYRDLPLEARRARPMLTPASGAAASLLSFPRTQHGELTLQRLLLDSTLLHADWSVREDTDAAVCAGTIRMIGERRLPTTQAGQSLDAAWRTKQEIDSFIDTRCRAGIGPGRTSHAIFRAFSARLALFRCDPRRAMSEAQWAEMLSDWEPVSALASGVAALSRSIAGIDEGTDRSEPRLEGVDDDLGVCGIRGLGHVLQALADGKNALRRLDQAGVDRSLALVSPEVAAVAGIWSVQVTLAALRAGLWGDAAAGLRRLGVEPSRQSSLREHEEPLGGALMTRVRATLLAKVGAFGAATNAVEALPAGLKALPLARMHLWAGQYARAIRTVDSARYEAGLAVDDQEGLTFVKVAASLLSGTCGAEARAAGVAGLSRMMLNENFLPFALVPRPARDALVELYRSDGDPGDPRLQLLLARLELLGDAAASAIRPVRLTERERLLLPHLATDDTVPEIARKLQVSVNTVRKQVVTLREKFGAENRAELITKALAHGSIR